MNVRRAGMIAAVVGVFAVCAFGWWAIIRTLAPEVYLDIDQAQIQQRLAAHFPQHNCTLGLACIDLSEPVVVLAEGTDRIGFAANVNVTLGRRQMAGRVAFSGVLRYVRFQGDFYLEDIRVDDLQFSQFPPELATVLRLRGPGAIRRALAGQPVYTIKGDTAREALLKLTVSDVRVVNGRVRVTFLRFG